MTEHHYYQTLPSEEHDVTEELIAERERDIDSITRELYEINDIFKTLNTVVQEQGYLLDHIENNVSDVVINVENAEDQLSTAYKKQKKTGKWLWWIFWFLLTICIITIIIIVVLNIKH